MPTVFHSGTIRTFDDDGAVTDAIAVEDGRILALGKDALEMLDGNGVESVDLAGQTVLPGIIDVHNHHNQGGHKDLYELQIPPTASLDELLSQLSTYAQNVPEGEWIFGGSAGANLIPEIDRPETLERLDAASHGHPVLLTDDSIHNRWANSLALSLSDIDDSTPDPAGGRISRDHNGHATGWLLESSGAIVEHARARLQPPPSTEMMNSSARGVAMLNSYGITGFQDAAASKQIMQAVHQLDTEGRLNAWVVSASPVEEFIFGYSPVGEEVIFSMQETRSKHHRPDFIKIFLDGVPPAYTGAFLEPYLPSADGHDCGAGHLTMAYEKLEGWLLSTADAGLSAKIHCTGDASVRAVLDAVEVVRKAGYTEPKYHVAHGQFVSDPDIPRFAQLDVTADLCPAIWFPGVIPQAIAEVLGAERGSKMQPNRLLLDSGARLAVGSDWPVAVSPNPWPAIYGLVTRRDPEGLFEGQLWPEQAITMHEALAAYTIESARAIGIDDVSGSLEVGKSADFVVLPLDPMTVDPRELIDLKPNQTWFAGTKVYSA